MTREQLEKVLFGKRTRVFAILDSAAIPDLRMRLYEMSPPHYCLYRGKLEPDLAEVMPYVVGLLPGSPFAGWLLSESFGKNWGIFAHCRHSIKEMRKHFREIFTVYDEQGNPMIFRFYDPRVLRSFLPTCEGDELKSFFGKVETFYLESEKGQALLSYSFDNGQLKKREIS